MMKSGHVQKLLTLAMNWINNEFTVYAFIYLLLYAKVDRLQGDTVACTAGM